MKKKIYFKPIDLYINIEINQKDWMWVFFMLVISIREKMWGIVVAKGEKGFSYHFESSEAVHRKVLRIYF